MARFSIGLGGAAECALTFSGLDIVPSRISGTATGSFTGVLGIGTSLRGTFSFDGQTVILGYPDAVTFCGISVSDAILNISPKGVTGSGRIAAAGKSTTVSITIENGIMKLNLMVIMYLNMFSILQAHHKLKSKHSYLRH